MPAASEGGAPRSGRRAATRPRTTDFAALPVYRSALRLCGLVYDLEAKFPDDERDMLLTGLKRVSVEIGSCLAAGFGHGRREAGFEMWTAARSKLMEARHYVLFAKTRYFVDAKDLAAFDAVYVEVLSGIDALLADSPAPREVTARGKDGGGGRS